MPIHGVTGGLWPAVTAAAMIGLSTAGLTACGSSDTVSASSQAQPVTEGLQVPWGLDFLPDRSALVTERDSGRIMQVPPDGGVPTEVMRVPDVETEPGEGGLLGLAVSPDYAADAMVYAYYTTDHDNRIVRFRLAPRQAGPPATGKDHKAAAGGLEGGTIEPILTGLAKAEIHNGGRIAFGPDGMLYAGVGDASIPAHAQDRSSLNGKILRMRPDGSAPPDNPDPGSLVYSSGHRNVQGLAWDTAGRLWATEFGQHAYDEVNLIRPGYNYGWPTVEGQGDTRGGQLTNPVVTWKPTEASPSGAAIIGTILYVGALRGERMWMVPLDGENAGTPRAALIGEFGRLRTLTAAPDGSLWITTSNTDGRGTPRDDDDKILRFTTF